MSGGRPVGAGAGGLVPFREIAANLGIPERSASDSCAKALRKLRKQPGVIETLRMVAEEHEVMKATSLECRKDLIERGW